MNLRSFQLSDIHAVTSIWQMTASQSREQETLKVLSKQLACDRDLVLVAEIEGRVVGAIVGTMEKETGFFYCLAVHPEYQGCGVGRSLAEQLEKRFQDKGVHRIQVVVDDGTKKLYPFYQHLGYQGTRASVLEKNWLYNLQSAWSY
ncbi:Predicted N-acetyltransferase YhbS [Melghirimyces thermohalophilus]|uniref:Predicted N-acetyltransferase YhbS n=1 Tax=Melghirimyces thermohalophilus TaxID=1236220 RepID=A0A1G6IFB9_9BACL|nr:GNAT family N-acetyltransferase [Melghirimyces thermohalophilus]SDC05247.1 Predicted N-acetyltransferase YhbS [Melghirimyces thermohalophilus]